MTVLTLELDAEQEPTDCKCCGNTTRTVHGFVHADSKAHAVYFASWTVGHSEKGVAIAIGIGEWGDGATPAQRRSVGLQCRVSDDQLQFMVQEPDQSPWGDKDFLGRMLSRASALEDPKLSEVFHIAEHVVADDALVAEFIATA